MTFDHKYSFHAIAIALVCISSVIAGCRNELTLIDPVPHEICGISFYKFRFADQYGKLYFGKAEISCAEFCRFLNKINYNREPFSVRHFLPFYNPTNKESAIMKAIFIVEHRDSNIVRVNGSFYPRSDTDAPANCVTYFGALAYCEFLSKESGKSIVLPSANIWYKCAKMAQEHHLAIDGAPGNVWEWCSDVVNNEGELGVPKATVRGGEYIARRRARISDKAYSPFLSGGEGEQGYGLRIIVLEDVMPESVRN